MATGAFLLVICWRAMKDHLHIMQVLGRHRHPRQSVRAEGLGTKKWCQPEADTIFPNLSK
ncbi:hypothetical protein BBA71_08275 [Acetobacter pasteurianus]|nr:hypothetical protein A4R89_03335 [Acetobacter ascendens]RCL05936.1 hypothetical protein BBA71_08275 [Acetobacter pasteurianus]